MVFKITALLMSGINPAGVSGPSNSTIESTTELTTELTIELTTERQSQNAYQFHLYLLQKFFLDIHK